MTTDTARLAEEYLPLVQAIAGRMRRQYGHLMEYGDLVGFGTKGLMEAAQRFDPRQGVPFTSFAHYRIEGAMRDGVRRMAPQGRAGYQRLRAEGLVNDYLSNLSEREGALRAADGIPAQDVEGVLEDISRALGSAAAIHYLSLEALEGVPDEKSATPAETVERGQRGMRLRRAVARLPEKERRLTELCYFDGKTLVEAAGALGLSKSWASRLHARAVDLLRDMLKDEA